MEMSKPGITQQENLWDSFIFQIWLKLYYSASIQSSWLEPAITLQEQSLFGVLSLDKKPAFSKTYKFFGNKIWIWLQIVDENFSQIQK